MKLHWEAKRDKTVNISTAPCLNKAGSQPKFSSMVSPTRINNTYPVFGRWSGKIRKMQALIPIHPSQRLNPVLPLGLPTPSGYMGCSHVVSGILSYWSTCHLSCNGQLVSQM